jgi:hypothetical protein
MFTFILRKRDAIAVDRRPCFAWAYVKSLILFSPTLSKYFVLFFSLSRQILEQWLKIRYEASFRTLPEFVTRNRRLYEIYTMKTNKFVK